MLRKETEECLCLCLCKGSLFCVESVNGFFKGFGISGGGYVMGEDFRLKIEGILGG